MTITRNEEKIKTSIIITETAHNMATELANALGISRGAVIEMAIRKMYAGEKCAVYVTQEIEEKHEKVV